MHHASIRHYCILDEHCTYRHHYIVCRQKNPTYTEPIQTIQTIHTHTCKVSTPRSKPTPKLHFPSIHPSIHPYPESPSKKTEYPEASLSPSNESRPPQTSYNQSPTISPYLLTYPPTPSPINQVINNLTNTVHPSQTVTNSHKQSQQKHSINQSINQPTSIIDSAVNPTS